MKLTILMRLTTCHRHNQIKIQTPSALVQMPSALILFKIQTPSALVQMPSALILSKIQTPSALVQKQIQTPFALVISMINSCSINPCSVMIVR